MVPGSPLFFCFYDSHMKAKDSRRKEPFFNEYNDMVKGRTYIAFCMMRKEVIISQATGGVTLERYTSSSLMMV